MDEAPLSVPDLSRAQTVLAPNPALNSWAPYSVATPEIELDHVKVMVEDPAVVTLPNQISESVAVARRELDPLGPGGHAPAADRRHGVSGGVHLGEDHEHVTDGLGRHRQCGDGGARLGGEGAHGLDGDDRGVGELVGRRWWRWCPPAAVTVTSTVPGARRSGGGDLGGGVHDDAGGGGGAELDAGGPGEVGAGDGDRGAPGGRCPRSG